MIEKERSERERGEDLTGLLPAKPASPGLKAIEDLQHPYLEQTASLYAAGRGAVFLWSPIAEQYGFCLLSPEGVQKIAGLTLDSGVLSIGAGRGYSESLLEQMGVDVLAYDIHVPDRTFCNVQQAGVEVVSEHSERTLLLLYPDGARDQLFAMDAIDRFYKAGGKRFIFVGETESCVLRSHDPCLYQLMDDRGSEAQWKEIEHFRLPDGPGPGRRPAIRVFESKK
jgi:hypothetical protein